ncbi:hypothetical protein [Halomarina pelagica]|uniref:hypothetical protein n=1 Tax=Halomarina pelagica TaxID=2961599 RepID=UPI0020C3A414|nr:hypothetical protein [Halomarina sp. BND7]
MPTTTHDRRSPAEYALSGSAACSHPPSARTYLGHNGALAFHRCDRCEAVVLVDARSG